MEAIWLAAEGGITIFAGANGWGAGCKVAVEGGVLWSLRETSAPAEYWGFALMPYTGKCGEGSEAQPHGLALLAPESLGRSFVRLGSGLKNSIEVNLRWAAILTAVLQEKK